MNKLLKVARREYLYNLRRPAFLFSAFGTPIFIIIAFAITTIAAQSGDIDDLNEFGKIGYVDSSANRVFAAGATSTDYPELFTQYESADAAKAALDAEEIAAYFELPAAYMVSGRVNLYSYRDTPDLLTDEIQALLLANLTAGQDLPIPLERIQESPELTVQTADGAREASQTGVIIILLFPIIFAFLLILSSLTTSGFLMAGLVEERTNRVIEMLVTSITPFQILAGKIIGLGLLGLTQVVILIGAAVLGLSLGRNLDFLQGVSIPADLIVLSLVYFLLTYFFIASIMAGVGALSNSEQESRQVSGFLTMPFMIPYVLLFAFISDPNGALPTILSFIPFTAPLSMMMRLGLTSVPAWQIALSLLILTVSIVFSVWAASKVFRWGLLLYGKKFNFREILGVIFSRQRGMATSTPITRQEAAV